MTFSEAFEQVKTGKGMRLPQWSPDVVIKAQYPDENSKTKANGESETIELTEYEE